MTRILGPRAAIRRIPDVNFTSAGLYLPDVARDAPREVVLGEVVAAGSGVRLKDGRRIPLDVAPGDRVAYISYARIPATIDGEKLEIVEQHAILAQVA